MRRFVYLLPLLLGVAVAAQENPPDLARRVAQSYVQERLASLPPGNALVPQGEVVLDDLGQGHVRYQQYFEGVPVFEGEAIVHVDLAAEAVLGATDAVLAVDGLDVRPAVAREHAHSNALAHFGLPPGLATKDGLAILVREGTARLAWQIRVVDDSGNEPVDKIAFVEARGGRVVASWDNLQTAPAAGTGKGFFNGTVALTTNSTSTGFSLTDPSRGNQYTVDLQNKQGGSGKVFTDTDNVWGDFTLSNRQTVGVDAQYGTGVTWDYFKLVHGRNGIANNGAGAYNRVHYGRNYNNAFWSDSCFCMTYGDGDGKTFNPFDSLDVAGHEMSHGVTSRTANLTYSGESGGLNEGTSDIFGTMVEYYASNPNDTPDYLIGERLYKSGTNALRAMYKPSLDGASADCWYSGVGSLNVHYSSGVANHFYYLLAEGTAPAGGPTSPTCKSTDTRTATGTGSLTGIGRATAERIWYRALSVYMTASTNYAAARVATLNAASDLYGSASAERAAVAAAWTAVKVN